MVPLLWLTCFEAATAATLQHTFRFDVARLRMSPAPAGSDLQVEGLERTWERERPALPYATVNLLVPRGTRFAAVRATTPLERPVPGVAEVCRAAPIAGEDGREAQPPRAAHASSAYPAALAEVAGTGALHGYQFVSLRVYPLRVVHGVLRVAERIDLTLDLEPGGPPVVERSRYSAAIEARARRELMHLVANPEALDGYDRRIGVRVDKLRGGFRPSDAPSLEGSDVDYVIVTTEALAATYQVLADWKTRRGVPSVVRTVEWIRANYRQGSDVQETIRTFLRDAYAQWGVQYVLLGGDTDILPARYGYSEFGPETERSIPTDLYFACLDGNWNADGDALWGEAEIPGVSTGDQADYYAEVYVGRAPFSSVAKASAFITKLLTYENPTQTLYQAKLLLLAEVLFPLGWQAGQNVSLDGADFCQEFAGLTTGCIAITKLYENNVPHGVQPLTLQNTLDQMNSGFGFVNHVGHGYRYNMSCGDVSLQNSHALALTNTDKRFVIYMLNCTATAFDFPCLAEAYLESAGGAVAVLGASRAAYALPSKNYNRAFFDALHQQGIVHVGETFAASRLGLTPNTLLDTADHYTHFIYNLLGDPEMIVQTCALAATAVTHPPTLGLGPSNVAVHVTAGGSPRAGALVCLQKGDEAYAFGTTDAGGDVTLAFQPETAGSVTITVSGPGMTTYLGGIGALSGAVAHVSTQSVTLDDDESGASRGNDDGNLDAGESVEYTIVFRNGGGAASASATGILRVASPWVTVKDSTYALPAIAAGSTATSANEVAFEVASSTPDGTVLPLEFRTTSGGSTWIDTVLRVVHASRMELALLDVVDAPPGGNGDGLIQAGETFDLAVYHKNYGTGTAEGLLATLTSSDPHVSITTGATVVGRALPQQQVTGTPAFRLSESLLEENPLRIVLTDERGRTVISDITLRGPQAPPPPALDASAGSDIVILSWSPNVEPDLIGYHVYRALSFTGPWTRATVDRTQRVAYFRNTGLLPSTRYFFYVTAVDSSGNESTPSTLGSVNTSPAQLSGWPIALAASSSCPPVVGDITGDGQKEIVAGNAHLYAWSADGIELRDDDADPQTWGLFVHEIQIITGAVALAELDVASPGFEVFVTSWDDTNKAFAVRGDGGFLPGWPRNPDATTSPKGYWATSSAMDVDGDGVAEVFAPAKSGRLYAWHADGTPLGASDAFKSGLGSYARTSVSFANLDSDPYPEIVYGAPNGTLNVWNADGSNVGAFPKSPGTECLSQTAIGDVDADGILDIVMITEGGAINVYDSKTGNQLPGWPVNLPIDSDPKTPSPALADFDFDGDLEIVVATNSPGQSLVRVFDHLGNVLPGWPRIPGGYTSESSPIVADFSGDGLPDVLFGNEGGFLHGWDAAGNDLAGFPIAVGDFIRAVPYADDVDGDGNIDLVLSGWDKNVYVWDFPVPYVEAAAQWPTLGHDIQRSGWYDFRTRVPTDAGIEPRPSGPAPRASFLAQNAPNPFNPSTWIVYGIAGGVRQVADVRLEIFDVRGRRVRQMVRATQAPGEYRVRWDGCDDAGRALPSGIYFYRLSDGSGAWARKLLLLE